MSVGCIRSGCQRNRYNDPKTRLQHPFCGQTCARQDGRLITPRPIVDFYNHQLNPHTAFLGNFYPCSLKIADLTFPCSEALFQAAKFFKPEESMSSGYNRRIATIFTTLSPTPNRGQDSIGDAAWKQGQLLQANPAQFPVRPDWRQVNVQIMENILRIKYTQNPHLLKQLLNTGSKVLNERTDRDEFWGDGDPTGQKGANHLGQLHMKCREYAQNNNNSINYTPSPHDLFLLPPPSQHPPSPPQQTAWKVRALVWTCFAFLTGLFVFLFKRYR
jgi:N-glycosidase YbiA